MCASDYWKFHKFNSNALFCETTFNSTNLMAMPSSTKSRDCTIPTIIIKLNADFYFRLQMCVCAVCMYIEKAPIGKKKRNVRANDMITRSRSNHRYGQA